MPSRKSQPDESASSNTFPPRPIAVTGEELDVIKRISDAANSLYAVTSNGTSLGELSEFAIRIENGFKFTQDSADTDFSPFHIERLLDQAADLIDRGIRDRERWDDLSEKAVTLALQMKEVEELDQISQEEEAKGSLSVSYNKSKADYETELISKSSNEALKSRVESLVQNYFSNGSIELEMKRARQTTWATSRPNYYFRGQDFDKYANGKFENGPDQNVGQYAIEASEGQVKYYLEAQRDAYAKEAAVYDYLAQTSSKRLEGFSQLRDWNELNQDFMRRRSEVSRNVMRLRQKAVADKSGALNFVKRLVPLKKRFSADFRDALARLRAIQQGLDAIYGYDIPLPDNEGELDFFDDCLQWVRDAIQWLIRFSQIDQQVVIPISIRTLVGNEDWLEQSKKGEFIFSLDQMQFPELAHIRLKGVSAYVSSCSVIGILQFTERPLWKIRMHVPPTGFYMHLNGQTRSISQQGIPPCLIGTARNRDIRDIPTIAGQSALLNTSPIGEWHVKVIGSTPTEIDPRHISDIMIDLHLAYRHKSDGIGLGESDSRPSAPREIA